MAVTILDLHPEKIKINPETGCWVWVGCLVKDGYGRVWVKNSCQDKRKGTLWLAHRLSYWLHKGKKPKKFVLHECDNPPCCNPEHLFEGDSSDNMKDCWDKQRRTNECKRGVLNPISKLTPNQVRVIRDSKETLKVLAARYSLCKQTVSQIKRRERWAWLP